MQSIQVRNMNNAQKEPYFSGSFVIRDLEQLMSGSDMIQELHRHDFFFVLVLRKARGEHIIDFETYPVKGLTVFLMRPGQVHQLSLQTGSSGYLMQFSREFYLQNSRIKHRLGRIGYQNYYPLDSKVFERITHILTNIQEEFNTRPELYEETIRANLDLFFIELLRQQPDSGFISNAHVYPQHLIDELQVLLEAHSHEHKRVSDYASMLHLTSYQLNAVTKSLLGKTCSQLINEQLILEAKRQLLATQNQVKEIAIQLGFEDISYFIRFFKKHTRYSPGAYRQNIK